MINLLKLVFSRCFRFLSHRLKRSVIDFECLPIDFAFSLINVAILISRKKKTQKKNSNKVRVCIHFHIVFNDIRWAGNVYTNRYNITKIYTLFISMDYTNVHWEHANLKHFTYLKLLINKCKYLQWFAEEYVSSHTLVRSLMCSITCQTAILFHQKEVNEIHLRSHISATHSFEVVSEILSFILASLSNATLALVVSCRFVIHSYTQHTHTLTLPFGGKTIESIVCTLLQIISFSYAQHIPILFTAVTVCSCVYCAFILPFILCLAIVPLYDSGTVQLCSIQLQNHQQL